MPVWRMFAYQVPLRRIVKKVKKTTTKTAFRYIFATAATSYGLFYLQWVSYCISVPFKRLKRNMLDIMCEFENAVLRSELKRNRKFVMYTKLHTQHIHDNCRGCVINNLSLISSKFLFLLCNWYKTFLKGWFTFHFLERKKKITGNVLRTGERFFFHMDLFHELSLTICYFDDGSFIQSTHPSCCNSIKL